MGLQEHAWVGLSGKGDVGSHGNKPSALDSARLTSDKSEAGSHHDALFLWLRLLLFELLILITQV